MLRTATIVKAIKTRYGYDVELYQGNGYFYFVGECVENAPTTMVYVNTLNQLSLDGWLADFLEILKTHNNKNT